MSEENYIKFKQEYTSTMPSDFLLNNNKPSNHQKAPIEILNKQLLDIYEKIKPNDYEKRCKAVESLAEIISKEIKSKVNIQIFGSVAIKNYLPSSDIDIRISIDDFKFGNMNQINLFLSRIDRNMLAENISCVHIIARVPILKISFLGFKFDLSVSDSMAHADEKQHNHTILILKAYKEIKGLKELHLLLKQYLENRNFSISNIAQFVLCYNFLFFHPVQCNVRKNLGVIMMDFFQFYGHVINRRNLSIKICMKGFEASDTLTVEDPLSGNNLSFNFGYIQATFSHSYRIMDIALKEFMHKYRNKSTQSINFASLWLKDDYSALNEIRND